MSIEVFNNRRNKKTTLTAGFMTAEEARNHFNNAVTKLAAEEVKKALEKMKANVEKGLRSATFAFSYNASNEVIEASVQMLKELHYNIKMSDHYHDVIHIYLPEATNQ